MLLLEVMAVVGVEQPILDQEQHYRLHVAVHLAFVAVLLDFGASYASSQPDPELCHPQSRHTCCLLAPAELVELARAAHRD